MPESTTLPGCAEALGRPAQWPVDQQGGSRVQADRRNRSRRLPAGVLDQAAEERQLEPGGACQGDIVIPGDKYTEAIKAGRLVITFTSGKKLVNFRIKAGGVKVGKGLEALAKKRKIGVRRYRADRQ